MKRILLIGLTILAFTSCKKESVECVKIKDIQPIYNYYNFLYAYQLLYDDNTSKEIQASDIQKYNIGYCK